MRAGADARARLVALYRGRCLGYAVVRVAPMLFSRWRGALAPAASEADKPATCLDASELTAAVVPAPAESLPSGSASRGPVLIARVAIGGLSLDLPVFIPSILLGLQTPDPICVIAFPLIAGGTRCDISLCEVSCQLRAAMLSFSVTGTALKWHSRKNYAINKGLVPYVRDVERARASDAIRMEPIAAYPYDDETYILRVAVQVPAAALDRDWVWGARIDGADASSDIITLHDDVSEQAGPPARTVVLSLRMPRSHENAFIHAHDPKGAAPGFALGIIPQERDALLGEFHRLTEDAKLDARYPTWLNLRSAGAATLARQREAALARTPLVSIVVPLFKPNLDFLRAAVDSVAHQSYSRWELILVNGSPDDGALRSFLAEPRDERVVCVTLEDNRGIVGNTNAGIEAARGDYIAFLDQDDLLLPEALFRYVEAIGEDPSVDLIYCDEDSCDETGARVFSPLFKPDFNRDLLYSHNYVVHMLMVSRRALDLVELSQDDVNGAQDFDLTLKVSEVARAIRHIPRVLYRWRRHAASSNAGNEQAKPYAVAAGRTALSHHFARRDLRAQVSLTDVAYVYRSTFAPPAEHPLVSILIPSKDHADYLEPCVRSVLARAGYERFEILVIENNSELPETACCYDALSALDARVRVVSFEGPFNYARIINYGVSRAQGECLLLLNNDTEVISEGFLATMLGYLQRPEVGVVGPLMLFRDGLIQHAGIALMSSGRLGFMNQNHSLALNGGYLGSSSCACDVSAVLGACQMTSRAVFEEVGGYCEDLGITYNDVDFCWRARARGYEVVYTPYASLYHREFGSRGLDRASRARATETEREAGIMRARWPERFACGDPWINPNCDRDSAYFKLGA